MSAPSEAEDSEQEEQEEQAGREKIAAFYAPAPIAAAAGEEGACGMQMRGPWPVLDGAVRAAVRAAIGDGCGAPGSRGPPRPRAQRVAPGRPAARPWLARPR